MTIRLPHRGWLLDLDGTVYVGERLVPGADTTIAALRAAGRRVAFLSNKPLETREAYAGKLTRLGVPARPDDVVNSSLVLARHLRRITGGRRRQLSTWRRRLRLVSEKIEVERATPRRRWCGSGPWSRWGRRRWSRCRRL